MSKHAEPAKLFLGDVVRPRGGGDRAVVVELVTVAGVAHSNDQRVMVRPLRKSSRWLTGWHTGSDLRVVKRRRP